MINIALTSQNNPSEVAIISALILQISDVHYLESRYYKIFNVLKNECFHHDEKEIASHNLQLLDRFDQEQIRHRSGSKELYNAMHIVSYGRKSYWTISSNFLGIFKIIIMHKEKVLKNREDRTRNKDLEALLDKRRV